MRGYLFPAANLAKAFRAKWLQAAGDAGLRVKATIAKDWVVDCKSVGSGQKALVDLGRDLYRGVLPEKDILSDRDGLVTFRIRDNTGAVLIQSVAGTESGPIRSHCEGVSAAGLHPSSLSSPLMS